jgi:outer membrane protein assembly factor BamB
MSRTPLAPEALAVTAFVLLVCLADWPQWRGPARDGHADAALPAKWPEKAPAPLWKTEVGSGQGSPVVAGGRVFVMGRSGTEEACYGLDADTGKVLWKHAEECPFKPADSSAGEGPKSTPTVSGGRVFMFGVAGRLSCFTVAGKREWSRDLKADFWGVAKDKWGDDAFSTCCGAASSPLVDAGQVILPVGGKKAGAMAGFDVKTGKTLWRSPSHDRSSYSSPLLATLAGKRQLVGFTGLRMAGFTPGEGKMLWSHDFPQDYEQTIITPIIHGDLVILGGKDADLVALKVTEKGAEVAWKNELLRAYTTSPVAFAGHCVGLNMRGDLVCVDLKTGKTAWIRKLFGNNYHGSLVVAGKRILILTHKGKLHAVAADPAKFVREGVWKVAEPPVWPSLAVAGGRIYVKDDRHVYCYDLSR